MKNKRIKWTNDEIETLKLYYENGVDLVLEKIGYSHPRNSVVAKANKIGLNVDMSNLHYDLNEISKVISESKSFKNVFRKLNKSDSGEARRCLKNI